MKKIILDTDIGCDCDDAGALALLLGAQKLGDAQILAVTLSTRNPYAAACVNAITEYRGYKIPVGQTGVAVPFEDVPYFEKCYAKHVSELYGKGDSKNEEPQDAVKLLRKTLCALADDEKATIVSIGPLTNLAELIKSGADDISPLDGKTLIERKVAVIGLMGGHFRELGDPEVWFGTELMEAECNIKTDPQSAKYFFENCPVNAVVVPFCAGRDVLTGNVLIQNDRKDPAAECYFVHSQGNRCSWDPITAFVSVYGFDYPFGLTERGTICSDERGVTHFEICENGKFRVVTVSDIKEAEKVIDKKMLAL